MHNQNNFIATPLSLVKAKLENDWRITIRIELIRLNPEMQSFVKVDPRFLTELAEIQMRATRPST